MKTLSSGVEQNASFLLQSKGSGGCGCLSLEPTAPGRVSWGLSGPPRWAGPQRLGSFPEPGHTGQQTPQSRGQGPGFPVVPKRIFLIITPKDTRRQRPGQPRSLRFRLGPAEGGELTRWEGVAGAFSPRVSGRAGEIGLHLCSHRGYLGARNS